MESEEISLIYKMCKFNLAKICQNYLQALI